MCDGRQREVVDQRFSSFRVCEADTAQVFGILLAPALVGILAMLAACLGLPTPAISSSETNAVSA
jgi:hypothetical protein